MQAIGLTSGGIRGKKGEGEGITSTQPDCSPRIGHHLVIRGGSELCDNGIERETERNCSWQLGGTTGFSNLTSPVVPLVAKGGQAGLHWRAGRGH